MKPLLSLRVHFLYLSYLKTSKWPQGMILKSIIETGCCGSFLALLNSTYPLFLFSEIFSGQGFFPFELHAGSLFRRQARGGLGG